MIGLLVRTLDWLLRSRPTVGLRPDELGSELKDNLSLESFKACRQLMVENIKIMERNESFVLGAIGAVITFSIGRPNPVFKAQLVLIPLVIILGIWRYIALKHVIDLADDFTVQIERNTAIGWTTYYRARRSGSLGHSRRAFWFAISICAAAYLIFCLVHGPYLPVRTSPPGLQKV